MVNCFCPSGTPPLLFVTQSIPTANPQAIRLDNPELSIDWTHRKHGNGFRQQIKQCLFALSWQAQHHISGRLCRRVAPDVRQIEVGGNQDSVFILAYINDAFVGGASQRLLIDRHGIVAGSLEQFGGFNRQILVDLELHAAIGTSSS